MVCAAGVPSELTQYPGEPAPRLTFAALPGGSFLGYRRPDGTVSPPALTPCGTQWSGDFAAGDIVTGELRILGRGDDVFRSNGHLVAPAELESLLERHESVHAAAVVAARSDGQSLVPVAYVEADDGADPNEIRVWANSRLQHEVDVASVTVVDALPRSINGKVQRALLARTAYP